MNLEQAQSAVLLAEAKLNDLTQAAEMLRVELPMAQQALEAARSNLRRVKGATGTAVQRGAELEALKRQIALVKGELSHV